jgi:hypothetical protein
MLYIFKSKAAGDLIMLEGNGARVLEIIGKSPGAKGIILAAEMHAAIAALNAAVAQEEQARKTAPDPATPDGKSGLPREAVSLRQRAHPFIDMLNRCSGEGADVVWGV